MHAPQGKETLHFCFSVSKTVKTIDGRVFTAWQLFFKIHLGARTYAITSEFIIKPFLLNVQHPSNTLPLTHKYAIISVKNHLCTCMARNHYYVSSSIPILRAQCHSTKLSSFKYLCWHLYYLHVHVDMSRWGKQEKKTTYLSVLLSFLIGGLVATHTTWIFSQHSLLICRMDMKALSRPYLKLDTRISLLPMSISHFNSFFLFNYRLLWLETMKSGTVCLQE